MRLSEPIGEAVVGGHGVASLAPRGLPDKTVGFDFRTSFSWDSQYDGYGFELCGLIAGPDTDPAACPAEMAYRMTMEPGPSLDGPEDVVLILRTARVMQLGIPIFGRVEWEPGWAQVEYSHVGVTPGSRGNTRVADEGLRLFANIPKRKRGPTPGTVKATKYKDHKAWHIAIHEKVLTKPIETKVKTQIAEIAASRLGISTSTMRRLQGRWQSEALENVLNGKYWGAFHSCRP